MYYGKKLVMSLLVWLSNYVTLCGYWTSASILMSVKHLLRIRNLGSLHVIWQEVTSVPIRLAYDSACEVIGVRHSMLMNVKICETSAYVKLI